MAFLASILRLLLLCRSSSHWRSISSLPLVSFSCVMKSAFPSFLPYSIRCKRNIMSYRTRLLLWQECLGSHPKTRHWCLSSSLSYTSMIVIQFCLVLSCLVEEWRESTVLQHTVLPSSTPRDLFCNSEIGFPRNFQQQLVTHQSAHHYHHYRYWKNFFNFIIFQNFQRNTLNEILMEGESH